MPKYTYYELHGWIADAEARLGDVSTEYEYEMIQAELEELYAARDALEMNTSEIDDDYPVI